MSASTDMHTLEVRKILIILGHAFVGWALCFATIAIGRATTTMDGTLIIHTIFTPIFFCLVSLVYFTKSSYTSPLQTALVFVGFVIFVDFFLVALVINRSLDMFTSLIGTWIPFALIFVSTYLAGWVVTHREQRRVRSA